jgi:hypothetical protein
MNTTEKRPLFELTASELEVELSNMFKPFSANHPIRCQVAEALMAAEATTQRLALEGLDAPERTAPPAYESLGAVFETVEALNRYLLEGRPTRIDLVLWDAAGYIHGWFLDQHGRPDSQVGSCPEAVATLAGALQTLAQHEKDWRPMLERYAAKLASLVRLAREKAEIQARTKVESQNWFWKLLSPTSLERELLSLGFR